MALTTTRKASTYKNAPAGVHGATCVDVIDLGMIQGSYGFYHACRIVWLIDKINEDKSDHFSIGQRFGLELTPNGAATKLLGNWRGEPLTDEEMDGFDLEKLIGVHATMNIIHVTKGNGKTYANIGSIMPHTKGLPLPDTSKYVKHIDRTEFSHDVRNPICKDYTGNEQQPAPVQQQQEAGVEAFEPSDSLPF